jgi:hypothetical protein
MHVSPTAVCENIFRRFTQSGDGTDYRQAIVKYPAGGEDKTGADIQGYLTSLTAFGGAERSEIGHDQAGDM